MIAATVHLKPVDLPVFIEILGISEGNVNKSANYVAFGDFALYRRGPVHDLAGSSSGVYQMHLAIQMVI